MRSSRKACVLGSSRAGGFQAGRVTYEWVSFRREEEHHAAGIPISEGRADSGSVNRSGIGSCAGVGGLCTAGDDGGAAATDARELAVGTAVVPVDDHVMIHRAMVRMTPAVESEVTDPVFLIAARNLRTRTQLRQVPLPGLETQKFDVNADEILLFHISRAQSTSR